MSAFLPEGHLGGEIQKPNLLLNVAIYPRKSNKTEGRSKSIQEQSEFCKTVSNVFGFSEENVTLYEEAEGQKGEWYWQDPEGKNPGPWRPKLTQLMRDIASGKVDVLIIWRSDRLVRDSGVGNAVAMELRKYGVRLICGSSDMKIDTATGLYQFNMEAAGNRRYRDQISEDIKRDHDFKMKLGLFTRDPSCLGFRSRGKGSQAANPIFEELELVNRIFRLFVIGEDEGGPIGISAICDKLMDEGTTVSVGAKGHKNKHPERISTTHIKTILRNPQYIGKFRHRKQEYDCKALLLPSEDGGKPQTAVPIALYEAAQEKLRLTDRPGKKSIYYNEHLLSGFVICAYCGRALHVSYGAKDKKSVDPKPASRRYRCAHSRPPRYCKNYGMKTIREEVIDEWVLSELAPLLMLEIEETRSSAGRNADIQTLAGLEKKIGEIRKKETSAIKDMLGVLDKDQIAQVAVEFRAEREQLQRKIQEVQARVSVHADLPDLSAETLATMSKSAIKDALRRSVQWIAIGNEGVLVLTSLGTYISAKIIDIPKGVYRTSETKIRIAPPTPAGTLRCLGWLPSSADFINGRRDSMGSRGEEFTDEEILPGIGTLYDGVPVDLDKVEVIVEDIHLD